MGASFNPEGAVPGLPPLPEFPAELPGAGPGLEFSIPGAAPATTTGIGFGGNEQPFVNIPANPGAITAAPGPMFDPSQFTPPSNATISQAVTAPPNPFGAGALNPPLLPGTIGGSAAPEGDPTTFLTGPSTTIGTGSAASGAPLTDPGTGAPLPTAATIPGFLTDPNNPLTAACIFLGACAPSAAAPGPLSTGGGGIDVIQTIINDTSKIITRFALVILGIVLLGIAVWYFGAKDVKDTVARAVR